MEDTVIVAADAMGSLVCKRRKPLVLSEIHSVIVGAGDRGNSGAFLPLYGLDQSVDASQAVVEAMAKWVWSLPFRLIECRFPIG